MPALHIRLTQKSDGSSVVVCTRKDGSETWQRRQSDFLALHDLTHFAVETTHGLSNGFYGLVADGWNITDFGERDIPKEEPIYVEALVALFDQERATGIWPEAGEFNEMLRASLKSLDIGYWREIAIDELAAIRRCIMELISQWGLTPNNESLELVFDLDPTL